jgi:hypothetical protein
MPELLLLVNYCTICVGITTIVLLILAENILAVGGTGLLVKRGSEKTKTGNGSGVVGIVCYEYHMFDGNLFDVHE